MRLLIAQHNINERGGAEKVILKIAQRYDATIYTLGYNKEGTFEEFKDVDIKVFSSKGKLSNLFPPRVANAIYYGYNFYNLKIAEDYDLINPHMSPSEWIRNNNPRVLWYCHTPPRELYDPTVANLRKRPLREKILYSYLSNVYRGMEKKVVKKIEAIATNSENTRTRIKKAFHAKATVINPGIDYKDFTNKGDKRYFLYPSRIAEQKRQEYTIEAFERFARQNKGGNYKLVLAGSLSSRYSDFEEYYNKLKAMKAKNVVFRLNPSNSELRNLYARCTAVLVSAINEDFGIVPLEGMASSKPVIAVNEGGFRETIVNGRTGFLVNSPAKMAEQMRFITEHSSIAKQMGKEGRRRVEANYSWSNFFKDFDEIARKVAKS
ncbi:MAG: glycosyltransferase [Candidatus Micrarchaeaceae archaeon]|jgi:glycosyltransferase involved in cell wall biosynthesis|nr:glycosyltransferase [Candidatus Micrarchaeota archaeon]HII09541.1 glycosyltransferase [Candidatus Micrarchaeota archaeon]